MKRPTAFRLSFYASIRLILALVFAISGNVHSSTATILPLLAGSASSDSAFRENITIDFSSATYSLENIAIPPPPIDSATLSLENPTVGVFTTAAVSFVNPDVSFPDDYIIGVVFPPGFVITPGDSVTVDDSHPGPDPTVRKVELVGNSILVRFRRTFFSPRPNQRVTISVAGVHLPEKADDYQAAVFYSDTLFTVFAGPSFTPKLLLQPGATTAISVSPSGSLTVRAGDIIEFVALGFDQYGNETASNDFVWTLTPESDPIGGVSPGEFSAVHTGHGHVSISSAGVGGASVTTGDIHVIPADLARIALSVGDEQFVGSSLKNATVELFDRFDNRKYDIDLTVTPIDLASVGCGLSLTEIATSEFLHDAVLSLSEVGVRTNGQSGEVALSASIGEIYSNSEQFVLSGIALLSPQGGAFSRILPAGKVIRANAVVMNNSARVACVDGVSFALLETGGKTLSAHTDTCLVTLAPSEQGEVGPRMLLGSPATIETDSLRIALNASFISADENIHSITTITREVEIVESGLLYLPNAVGINTADTILIGGVYEELTFAFGTHIPVRSIREAVCRVRNGSGEFVPIAHLPSPVPWGAGSGEFAALTLSFDSLSASVAGVGRHDIQFIAFVSDGFFSYYDSVIAPNAIFISDRAGFAVKGALVPDSVTAGSSYGFHGKVAVSTFSYVTVTDASFELHTGVEVVVVDAGVEFDASVFGKLSADLLSESVRIPTTFAGKTLGARFILESTQFGQFLTDTINFGQFAVTVAPLLEITIDSMAVVAPNAPFVNTGQEFLLRARLRNPSTQTVRKIVLELTSDGGSKIESPLLLDSLTGGSSILLELPMFAAPESSPGEIISLRVVGMNDAELDGAVSSVSVIIQKPALLNWSVAVRGSYDGLAQIHERLTLDIALTNAGESEISPLTARITASGAGLSVNRDILFNSDVAQEIPLGAPTAEGPIIIRVNEITTPLDQNTGLPAAHGANGDSAHIEFESVSSLTLAFATARFVEPLGVTPSETRALLELDLTNASTLNPSTLSPVEFIISLVDGAGLSLDPRAVLDIGQCAILDSTGQSVAGVSVVEGRLKFVFGNQQIPRGLSARYTVWGKIVATPQVASFRIVAPLTDIVLEVVDGPLVGSAITARTPSGAPGQIDELFSISQTGFVQSLRVRDNPFHPTEESAELSYFLPQATDVEVSLFTIGGELIFKKALSAGITGARVGVNFVSWDGKASSGELVRSGVYLVIVRNLSTAEEATLKLGVIR